MIKGTVIETGWAYVKVPAGDTFQVDHVIPNGSGFDHWYLIGIGMGFECSFFAVKADNGEDAMADFHNSKWVHLVETEPCEHCLEAKRLEKVKVFLESDKDLESILWPLPNGSLTDYAEGKIEELYNACECSLAESAHAAGGQGMAVVSYDEVRILARVKMDFFAKKED